MLFPIWSCLPTLACPGYYCNLHALPTATPSSARSTLMSLLNHTCTHCLPQTHPESHILCIEAVWLIPPVSFSVPKHTVCLGQSWRVPPVLFPTPKPHFGLTACKLYEHGQCLRPQLTHSIFVLPDKLTYHGCKPLALGGFDVSTCPIYMSSCSTLNWIDPCYSNRKSTLSIWSSQLHIHDMKWTKLGQQQKRNEIFC